MKAFLLDRYGRGQPLRLAELPAPQPGAGEVLVRIRAAGVNVLDAKIRSGEFRAILPYRLPAILGHDVAGVVVGVGPGVRQFAAGDEVYARPGDLRIGAFAELISVREDALAHKPENLGWADAASIPLVGLTAWQALVERAKVRRGQKVFIQAGSGGVGTFAIQLARHLGATVATTCSAASAGLVRSLGADVVIDYRKDDFEQVLRDCDVVLHSQDAATLAKSMRVLKPGGQLVSISGPPDPAFAKSAGLPWFMPPVMAALSFGARRQARRLGVRYSFLFMRPSASQLNEITRLLEAGTIRPVVDRVFPFESTNEALDFVEGGRAKGKVVIQMP